MQAKRSTLLTAEEFTTKANTRRQRGRGRPSLPRKVIGLTVYKLSMWGFSLRGPDGVYQVVAEFAGLMLGRAMGAVRVKQIYRQWFREENKRRGFRAWDGKGPVPPPQLPDRQGFQISSLIGRRPHQQWSLRAYAKALIEAGGKWPASAARKSWYPFTFKPYETLTPAARRTAEAQAHLFPRFQKRGRKIA